MKNGAVRIAAIYKDHASGNYKASLPHIPVINPIDDCTAVPCSFKLARVIQPYRSLPSAQSIQQGIFNCGVHDNVALKLSPREIFYLQLFICKLLCQLCYHKIDIVTPHTSAVCFVFVCFLFCFCLFVCFCFVFVCFLRCLL